MRSSHDQLPTRRTPYQTRDSSNTRLSKKKDHDDVKVGLSIGLRHHSGTPNTYSRSALTENYDDRAYQDDDEFHNKRMSDYDHADKKSRTDDSTHDLNTSSDLCSYRRKDFLMMLIIGLLAALLRFKNIADPPGIAFDEVHFGKFLSYYLKREFFFDVHPPLAKLMLAAHAWLIGYKGEFAFENIGDNYIDSNVPYVGLRSFSAILGSLTPMLVYAIMKESGYPAFASTISACLVVFDNGHILHTRLILLDAPLILFATCSIFAYIKFYKLRYNEFTRPWWTWLTLTGLALSLTISCKFVGLFTFFTIGSAVALDLWDMLDIRKGHSLDHIGNHVVARIICLIIIPFCVYLFWFAVHFSVLTRSGTGDDFMSAAFQQTLIDSPLTLSAEEIRYNDTLLLQHRATKCFLHSHLHRYPIKYEDGRVSSQGQQVTCYPHNDTNNHWLVEPTKPVPSSGRGQIVRHKDVIRLKHRSTDSYLYTHDVASPSMPTHQEFTTWPDVDQTDEAYNGTLWEVVIDDAHEGQQWKTKASHFQLVHHLTRAAMWTRNFPALPGWGFGQQEVNGHKMYHDKTLFWVASDIVRDNTTNHASRPPPPRAKSISRRSFFKKYFELQVAMLQHNSDLTESHPYASPPINWPFLLNGVSFWTSTPDLRRQVYMIGNPAGWWFCVMALSIVAGVFGADQFARRRGYSPIETPVRNRLYRSGGFFIIAWANHYFPFFLMNRQTFLHHYLPAHLFSALVAGVVTNFVVTEAINHPVSVLGPTTRRRPKMVVTESPKETILLVGISITILYISFSFIAPLTYGTPGLQPDQVNRRRLLSSWTLHFAK
ncbi:hypothetical protein PTTG_06724 [Puccinia triticina 1-1 BBBD Race 1]|uniref:Dolichyl-phosphate-mannose--protein mannosyltransferase n=1 Tax=Puccinia triticina (isolate 1-1 / race 1 (BBBD)) TaxID=630390 RepID=A0A180GMJ3_PUCT1|nr:hypothetical protein PTTG_06724 [Puccinia triticina 1-1 BBBD Race 1]